MTTVQQDAQFIRDVIPTSLLEDALGWVVINLNPEDVYDHDDLVEYCREHASPEEVFSRDQLAAWAGANGFRRF